MAQNSIATSKRNQLDVVLIDNTYSRAEISLFGGHVLSYIPKSDNRERLWLSEKALFDGSKPIRGGIPICWPWFADRHGQSDPNLPAHGYLRTQQWQMTQAKSDDSGTEILLVPRTTAGTGFNGNADVRLVIKVADQLSVNLHTRNVGAESFTFTAALHSYFALGDISHTQLFGLVGHYRDSLQQGKNCQTPAPYTFNQETDRIHLNQAEQLSIECENDTTHIQQAGQDSVVVWNPWIEKSLRMADMSDNGYTRMLCVETAITQGVTLAPGDAHVLEQRVY